ncbi:MAG: hypothetical protein KKH12_13595 [Gammaproteobacteria bacterium]|nr:hypothetical protein [Gammaproteobacteria bacterium]MBU1482692.1 hypothetical protein [Gammaproteobacteria bacterium]
MNKLKLTPICMAIGMAFAGSASAATVDFSGSNFYMKFLDGNMRKASTASIDTASGSDQGQFTELNLVFKATLSSKVEAGGRIQSRSSASYWTDYGGFGNEGNVNNNVNDMKFMKLRGAYALLTPGYDWLTQVRVGSSDWGMFDPFTVGKVRYIDRDNYNGFYFQGPMAGRSTWEFARVSLPNYLQFNYGQGATCCSTDATQYNEAVYIAQFKVPVGPVKLTTSYQSFVDHMLGATANPNTGTNTQGIYKNTVFSLKADGSVMDSLDLRGAVYRSTSDPSTGAIGENWGNTPTGSINSGAVKLDADWATPMDGLSFNFQYFNIGAGYFSMAAARRESDVLLTEGSESAWYNWGSNPLWLGGATADYTQGAASPKGGLGVPNGTQNGLTDNDFMDFNESPAESVVGWKGLTVVGKLDAADSPMSLELTRVGYNNNWQGYPTTGPLYNVFAANQDRNTNIIAFKLNHLFNVMGGLDTNFKLKRVDDKDKVSLATAADDRKVLDTGATISVGNQLFADLYGTVSYGRYIRDITSGPNTFNNSKSIYSLKFAYNLPGFETGLLTQWIQGNGNPTETVGANTKILQYRMKAYSQVNF